MIHGAAHVVDALPSLAFFRIRETFAASRLLHAFWTPLERHEFRFQRCMVGFCTQDEQILVLKLPQRTLLVAVQQILHPPWKEIARTSDADSGNGGESGSRVADVPAGAKLIR